MLNPQQVLSKPKNGGLPCEGSLRHLVSVYACNESSLYRLLVGFEVRPPAAKDHLPASRVREGGLVTLPVQDRAHVCFKDVTDCILSKWSSWGVCSQSCRFLGMPCQQICMRLCVACEELKVECLGARGWQMRSRQVLIPAQGNGQQCSGPLQDRLSGDCWDEPGDELVCQSTQNIHTQKQTSAVSGREHHHACGTGRIQVVLVCIAAPWTDLLRLCLSQYS